MQKVVVITGTSSGLGISLAVKFAQEGHIVYATMRDLSRQEALVSALNTANVEAQIEQLDVCDPASVTACFTKILDTHGKVDILINNAGAGYVRTTEQASEDDIQWMMDVNFVGVVRCIKAVLPSMRVAKQGHIINVSSVGGLVGQPFNEFYCAAKFALEGYVESVSTYITPNFNVHFTNVEPGGIATEFANNVLAQMQVTGGILDDAYRPILEKYIAGAQNRSGADNPALALYQTADQVADVIIDCAANPQPPIRTRTSPWSEQFTALKTQADPTGNKQNQLVIETLLS